MNSGILKNGSEEINLTPLYFDYCASTPIDPMVSQVLMSSSLEYYANPSSTHMMGLEIEQIN